MTVTSYRLLVTGTGNRQLVSSHIPSRPGTDSDLPGHRAELLAMVHSQSAFILPLMHHLMYQRFNGLAPSVPPDMTSTDDNLRPVARRVAMSVVSEPAFHSARHADGNPRQRAAESLPVQRLVCTQEPLGHRLVIVVGPL